MKRFTFSTDRLYIAKVLSIALTLAFSSCHKAEDIIGSLDKISYQSYLRNESGRGVTVFFRFDDGTSVLHYYMTENYPSDNHIYVPQKNNIFCTGLDFLGQDDTWTTIKIRPQRYRCEYAIK